MGITGHQRRALQMLADSPDGCTVPTMLAYGCAIVALRRMVRDQLATAARERAPRARRTVTVVRLRITDAGRRALTLFSSPSV
jgi:plasmid stabilization system protein ParE